MAILLTGAEPARAAADTSDSCWNGYYYETAAGSILVYQGSRLVVGGYGVGDNQPVTAGAPLSVVFSASGDGAYGTFAASIGGQYASGSANSTVLTANLTAPAAPGVYLLDALLEAGVLCTINLYVDAAITVVAAPAPAPAPAPAASTAAAGSTEADTTPPVVFRVRTARGRSGGKVKFQWSVRGETGKTSEVIDIRRNANAPVLRKWRVRAGVNPANSVTSIRVPKSIEPGNWVWCVTSTDQAGNVANPRCARLVLSAK